MATVLDLIEETKDLLKITARHIITHRSIQENDTYIIFKVAYEVIAENICRKIAETNKFIEVKRNATERTIELEAEVVVVKLSELFLLLKKMYYKGREDVHAEPASPIFGLHTLTTVELQKIKDEYFSSGVTAGEAEGYNKGYAAAKEFYNQ